MAYSIIEQKTRDIDLFLRDSEKQVHIATGGGLIPYPLSEFDVEIEFFKTRFYENLEQDINQIEIEVNPNLREILNLNEVELESYLYIFLKIARKGFYTYDKTNLEVFEDPYFHLVAKPKEKPYKSEFKNLLQLNRELYFPNVYTIFNIFEII